MKVFRYFLTGLFILPSLIWAQGLGISQDQITLDVHPNIVQANREVSIEVISYNTDIHRAQVSLYVDGILKEQGVGLNKFSVDAPAVGELKEVRIVVRTIDQGTVTKTLSLRPAQVDLLYKATNSYAPTLYEGKRLPAHEGGVTMVAIPFFLNKSGQKIDTSSLVYTWKIDDKIQESASGYGRDTFEYKGSPYYRTRSISVKVESIDRSLVAERTISMPAYDPVIRFYPENPLWGLDMSRAIIADDPLVLGVSEMKVRSVPFFISDADSDLAVNYDWRMNNQPLTTFGERDVINLRVPDDDTGQAVVNLKVSHNDKILQIAQSVFTVIFGEDAIREVREKEGGFSASNFFGTEE